jgi:oligopeptide transport system permease protein
MGRYVLRRLLQMVPVFFGATLLIFLMVYALPGDPIESLFGERAADPAVVAQLREQYNLDEPLWMQYLLYIQGVLTLDFGQTFSGQPVIDSLARAFPVTIKLALVAFVIQILVGIPVGLVSGLRRGGLFDGSMLAATLVVISIPIFVIGFVLQFVIGVRLGWVKPTVGGGAPLRDLLLPGLVLGSLSVAYVLRLTRTSVAENLRADYVRTATAKGLPRQRVVTVHLLATR